MVQGDTKSRVVSPWIQLSGHPDSFFPLDGNEKVAKWIKNGDFTEFNSYTLIYDTRDSIISFIPKFHGLLSPVSEHMKSVVRKEPCFVLSNLLSEFKNPVVMDVKMGSQTFVEAEEGNDVPREDLYNKIVKFARDKLTNEEVSERKVTKLRYLRLRDSLSTSSAFGFRIDALNKGSFQKETLANLSSLEEASRVISQFVEGASDLQKQSLVSELETFQCVFNQSSFCANHFLVASSLLIAYDMGSPSERVVLGFIDLFHAVPSTDSNCNSGILQGARNLTSLFRATTAQ